MYYWAGSKFGITIKSRCKECDINIATLQDMKVKEFAGMDIIIEIKPWLTHVWESLKKGGWHAPVVMIENHIFTQGIVFNREELAKRTLQLLHERDEAKT